MTTPDQPAQGSTTDYCSAVPGEPWHHIETFMGRSELYVRRCSLCGWIDFADLQQQAEAQQAAGRRQATEGWERVGYVALLKETDGRWTNDWDGRIHSERDDAEREVAESTAAGYETVLADVRHLVGPEKHGEVTP